MEHFDEKVLPELKQSICNSVSNNNSYDLPNGSLMISHLHTTHPKISTMSSITSEKILKKIASRTKKNKKSVLSVKGLVGKLKLRLNRQSSQMRSQNKKLQEHTKKIQEQDSQLADMRKHLEDWEQKLGDLTAELSRAREEVQKSETLDNRKRKHLENSESKDSSLLNTKDLQAKKRKLIVERKSVVDAQDVKFKKFLSELLGESSVTDLVAVPGST